MVKAIGLWTPVIVPLILSGLLLFSSEKRNKPKLYLAFYMLLITFIFAANLFYFQHNYAVYSWLHSLHIATVLAIYPGAYVYIRLLIDPGSSGKKLFGHFYPSLFFLLASGLIFYPFLNVSERSFFLSEYRFNPDFGQTDLRILYYVRMANILCLFLQVFIYPVLTGIALRRHRKHLENLFSNPEKFQFNWLKIFNIMLALSALISVFIYAVNPEKLFGDDRYLAYPLLIIAIILWFLGVMGNNQAPAQMIHEPDDKDIEISHKGINDQNIQKRLLLYFENQKPYLNPDLKIWDVAREIGTNRTYVSHTINQAFGQNFSSFVNSYRVKEVKFILDNDPQITLVDLALKTGFGSVLSLKRTFHQVYQQPVSGYKNALTGT